ncbi:MAG: hypothetical protein ACOYMY_04425 [Prochlorococcaceae cyanobacterium]|jgi:hypothetical protein
MTRTSTVSISRDGAADGRSPGEDDLYGDTGADEPPSRGLNPLVELAGLTIGLITLALPLTCIYADRILPLAGPPSVQWLGSTPAAP